jgi:hypothetical protein
MSVEWSNETPTVPGAYWVRNFNLSQREGEEPDVGLVRVELGGNEGLRVNLHSDSTGQQGKFDDWYSVKDLMRDLEWCGPLVEPSIVDQLRAENAAMRAQLDQVGRGTGKPCPACGAEMIDLRSEERRVCSCDHSEPWPLKPGQQPLVGPAKSGSVER